MFELHHCTMEGAIKCSIFINNKNSLFPTAVWLTTHQQPGPHHTLILIKPYCTSNFIHHYIFYNTFIYWWDIQRWMWEMSNTSNMLAYLCQVLERKPTGFDDPCTSWRPWAWSWWCLSPWSGPPCEWCVLPQGCQVWWWPHHHQVDFLSIKVETQLHIQQPTFVYSKRN